MRGSVSFQEPPEGVLAGEDVPMENEQEQVEESKIQKIMNKLKQRGEPFTSMSEGELREKALAVWHKGGD